MRRFEVGAVVALGMTTALGFVGGYIFHAVYGEARSAAVDAVYGAQEAQRVLQAYEPINTNLIIYRELDAARDLADLAALRRKHKEATLRNIESFERRVEKLELPDERRLAQPFLKEAERVRAELQN